MSIEASNKPEPLFYNLGDVADMIGLGRSATYSAVREGHIPTVRFGGQLKVPTKWVRAMQAGELATAQADPRRKRHSPRS